MFQPISKELKTASEIFFHVIYGLPTTKVDVHLKSPLEQSITCNFKERTDQLSKKKFDRGTIDAFSSEITRPI